jgi:hypothetical protein
VVVQTDLVKDMIMGYNREDVRPRRDVCAVGVKGQSASCMYSGLFTRELAVHDESPISGDGAGRYGVVQDNFCMSELEAVWRVGDEASQHIT